MSCGMFVPWTPTTPPFGQSLLGSLETRKFSQERGKFSRGHLLYRAATDVGGGRLELDKNLPNPGMPPLGKCGEIIRGVHRTFESAF